MTLEQRIAAWEVELNQSINEINAWTVRRCRAEGALIALRQLSETANETSNSDTSTTDGSDGAGS